MRDDLIERLRGSLPILPLAGGGGAWDTKAIVLERAEAADRIAKLETEVLRLKCCIYPDDAELAEQYAVALSTRENPKP